MPPDLHITLSFLLTFGVPIVLALRELRGLGTGGAPWRKPLPAPDPGPVAPDHGLKPLPECLVPKPLARVRELERV
jgi:hypothetical protein